MKLPEPNKKDGVCYAVTEDGVELPVVDVTHPAFALDLSDSEQGALVQGFMNESVPFASCPKPLRNLLLRILLRGSVLAQGIRERKADSCQGWTPTS